MNKQIKTGKNSQGIEFINTYMDIEVGRTQTTHTLTHAQGAFGPLVKLTEPIISNASLEWVNSNDNFIKLKNKINNLTPNSNKFIVNDIKYYINKLQNEEDKKQLIELLNIKITQYELL